MCLLWQKIAKAVIFFKEKIKKFTKVFCTLFLSDTENLEQTFLFKMAATKQSLMQAFTSKMKTPDEVESSAGDPRIRNSD